MKVPFSIIRAAQAGNAEAVNYIFKHFEGFIASRCLVRYEEADGKPHSYVDEDLRYLAETALSNAIFKFQLREPPEDFAR